MPELTDKQEKFAQAVAAGKTYADAYREAYPVSEKWKDESIWCESSKLMADPKVLQRVKQIQEQRAKANEVTLEDFMVNRFGRVLYEMFFEKYTEKVWGRHPRDISKEWGEQRIKGLSLIKAVLNALHLTKKKETTLIDEFLYPKYGCGQLWNLMADKITRLGGEIHYSSRVLDFENDENSIKSVKSSPM